MNEQHVPPPWQVWIDTGGTFTDCLALTPGGRVLRRKVLSSGRLRFPCEVMVSADEVSARVPSIDGARAGFFDGFEVKLTDGRSGKVLVHTAAEDGHRLRLQLSSSDSQQGSGSSPMTVEVWDGSDSAVLGLRLLYGAGGVSLGQAPPPTLLRLGTTRGTNALLERKGATTALVVTAGFGDVLEIGNQARPDIFAVDIVRPDSLPCLLVEVDERVGSKGEVLRPIADAAVRVIDPHSRSEVVAELRTLSSTLAEAEVDSVAVSLLHGYLAPDHERQIAELLETQFSVTCSHQVSALAGFVERTQTTVVNSYLTPLFDQYLASMRDQVSGGFLLMTSSGGLRPDDAFMAKDSLLSGPAGGVMGCVDACRRATIEEALTFDMGGTSTDVARIGTDGEGSLAVDYDRSHSVGGTVVVSPALAIRTVAAGGGSICRVEAGRLLVGPESAGASPGPACYGQGGPLTVTDLNLLTGRIDSENFEFPLDRAASERALTEQQRGLDGISREQLIEGFLAVANERMADAIRQVSTRRGFDPSTHALVAFGGAGGQHACALAELLGMTRVLVPEDCSLLSARGIGAAQREWMSEHQILLRLDDPGLEPALRRCIEEAVEAARTSQLSASRCDPSELRRRWTAKLRYAGQDSGLELPVEPLESLGDRFQQEYRALFGTELRRDIEVEACRVRLAERDEPPSIPACRGPKESAPRSGRESPVPRVAREALGDLRVSGPALITERYSSTWVAAGWCATTEPQGGGLRVSKVGTGDETRP